MECIHKSEIEIKGEKLHVKVLSFCGGKKYDDETKPGNGPVMLFIWSTIYYSLSM